MPRNATKRFKVVLRTENVTRNLNLKKHFFLQISNGDLLVSICHQPKAKKLIVHAAKAKNLRKTDLIGKGGNRIFKSLQKITQNI